MRGVIDLAGFRRDQKLLRKRGKNMEKLASVIESLANDLPLQPRHRPHKLSGDWAGYWECHIEPDWLLIYEISEDELVLVRTGTHSDLF